ncbi:MAG: cytochrome b/b6 domain-containing protein [Planctomycetota bacterium]
MVFTATSLIVWAIVGQGSPPVTRSCTDCHDPQHVATLPFGSSTGKLADSVHSRLDCVDCHAAISMEKVDVSAKKPHGSKVSSVQCGECHDAEAQVYRQHGRLAVGSNPDIPGCANCHGTHDILASSHRESRVHPVNLAATCEACHTNVDIIKNHDLLKEEPLKLYESSAHGRATHRGLQMAATCGDCHSAGGPKGERTAHRILSAADRDSTIYHFNIPDTCGKCHRGIAEDYWEGIHGQLAKRGEVDAPTCTRCHGEHGILPASDLRSPVSAARLAEATCAPCHESALLSERYGVPAGRLKSYVDSYHGLKRKAGNVLVANCASCHGQHRILPHTDPRSSIHPNNLPNTCGDCHPGISRVMATAPIHETATGIKAGWPRFVALFYIVLIVVTIGAMVVHNVGHWWSRVRVLARVESVARLSPGETAQHWVLMISFIVLVISGFSLRFSESWWVDLLFGWGGGEGFVIRGTIHRVSAVVFMIWAAWHLLYLCTARGRQWFKDMIATRNDVTHIKQNALYFLGRRNQEPRFGRFSYMEKCEYWALLWGAAIMTATGVLLWFDNYFVQQWHLPKGVLDVALVIHYYEAWLASLAIFVWHIYGTLFSPSVYPMNPAWWKGRMPLSMYTHEHPEGPIPPDV